MVIPSSLESQFGGLSPSQIKVCPGKGVQTSSAVQRTSASRHICLTEKNLFNFIIFTNFSAYGKSSSDQ